MLPKTEQERLLIKVSIINLNIYVFPMILLSVRSKM